MIPPANRLAALALCLAANLCASQTAAPASPATLTVRLRGIVQAVTPQTLTLKERSGEVVELALPDKLVLAEVYPIALADIQPGSFIGTAALPQADGTQRAIAITVFPEAARGTGEG